MRWVFFSGVAWIIGVWLKGDHWLGAFMFAPLVLSGFAGVVGLIALFVRKRA